ncbi:MAG: tRNA (adenosine(37)-N6)-dimethylallyltransferase MiaA [Syntrophales bacterium]
MVFSADIPNKFRSKHNLLVVLGPTAAGKTRLAVALARIIGGEIISADSRQVYREMDIGTGKDIADYSGEWGTIPVHLLDIIDPDEEFSVFAFQRHFARAFSEISLRGRCPLLAGGTGLYLDSILRRYRMEEVPENKELREELSGKDMESVRRRLEALNSHLHNKTDVADRKRALRAIEIAVFQKDKACFHSDLPALSPFVIGIRMQRQELRRRITARLKERLETGMIDEVRRLHENGLGWERIAAFGLEYRYVGLYLRGEMSLADMTALLDIKIHQFAKRQETWFRKMEKNGVHINWLNGADETAALSLIMKQCDE